MAHTVPLFIYKLRFFFGPAFRGRLGPLAFLGLILLFGAYGYGIGYALGQGLISFPGGQGVSLLTTPLAALLALGFLYSLGSGVTAHVSEFDFFMTARVRPREYLFADLVFQFVSLFGAGGVAVALAAVGLFVSMGRPLLFLIPFLLIFLAYAALVLMTIQILVVLGVRYPKAPLRGITLALLVLSLLPTLSLAVPAFPIRFQDLPIPPTAFGSLGYAILAGGSLDPVAIVVAIASLAALAAAWVALSDTYIFHGIRPSLSAGFGQVDMAARMNQQRRMIGGLSRLTKRVTFHADRGGDTSLMTRLHLIRIVRDGSLIFVLLFGFIAILPAEFSSGTGGESLPLVITQVILLLLGILALNWSYYDRENLWVVVTAPKTAASYFRGFMLSLMAIGLTVILVFLIATQALSAASLTVGSVALPLASQVGAASVAAALLTRLKVKPSAFSLGMLLLIFLPEIGGFIVGLMGEGVVSLVHAFLGLGAAVQAAVLAVYMVVVGVIGSGLVSRMGATFRM